MNLETLNKDANSGQMRYEVSLTADTGLAVVIPNDLNSLTTGLIIGTGTGKVQYTIDSTSSIKADTATWIDWPAGVVAETTVDSIVAAVTAVRGAWVSGTVKFMVVA